MQIVNYRDKTIDRDEFFEENFGAGNNGGNLLAIDMDNTMFDNDLGVLVFLEKLGDPHFWDFEVEEFDRLLMPRPYRNALKIAADNEQGNSISPELSRLALDLHADIVNLYALMKKLVGSGIINGQFENQVVLEFARKMIEFDQIFIKIDSHLTRQLGFPLLMRTRFFAGKELGDVHRMTKQVMDRRETAVDRFVQLEISEDLAVEADQLITEERISEAHGKPSSHKEVDRLVVTVHEVRDLIRSSMKRWDRTLGVVFSANLHGIAETAVDRSSYGFLRNQDEKKTVVGTKLRKRNGKLMPRTLDKPVLGDRKAFEAVERASQTGRHLALAFGDSPSTDGPMMRETLRDGGAAIIVTKDLDEAREKFSKILSPEEIGYRAQEKIYCLIPEIQR